jgi:hypothetical protein
MQSSWRGLPDRIPDRNLEDVVWVTQKVQEGVSQLLWQQEHGP